MHHAIELMSELSQHHLDWIFDNSEKQQVNTHDVVIQEASHPDAIYFVLKGVVGIYSKSAGDRQIAVLGPGEIIGEMSFLMDCRATASVVALETVLLLALSRQKLRSKLEQDLNFAASLYKSFAIVESRRLNERVGPLGGIHKKAMYGKEILAAWERLSGTILRFKELLQQADKEALRRDDGISPELVERIESEFINLYKELDLEIGDDTEEMDSIKNDLGMWAQREMLPYLLMTQSAERAYSKPRGYAGDYLTIDYIYRNLPNGSGRLGPLLDRCILNLPSAAAVRNRRKLLAEEIQHVVSEKNGSNAKITCLASGPAQEVFDVFNQLETPSKLAVTLVDIDMQALAFVSDRIEKEKLTGHIKLKNGNLIYLALGREHIDIHDQDLVYSMGLIDYFKDRFVIALLDYIYELLRPGGNVILGNFHSNNPAKAFLDHILEWKLIHRTEEDMNRLFSASKFGKPCSHIEFEKSGINIFASCSKP